MDPKVCGHACRISIAASTEFAQNRAALEAQAIDHEKPGLGQHYCVECAKYVYSAVVLATSSRLLRYYETDAALQSHWRSKVHKRRCKDLAQPAYTIEESEAAAGLGRDNRRARAVEPAATDVAMSK